MSNKVDDVLTFKVRKRTTKYERTPVPKEVRRHHDMVTIMRAIKRGDFDESKVAHKIGKHNLIKEGYIDSDLNILKEIE